VKRTSRIVGVASKEGRERTENTDIGIRQEESRKGRSLLEGEKGGREAPELGGRRKRIRA